MSWTDERVALLKKLWGEGKTAAEIAKELGGVTRNAVIGKAHRLKLSNRVSPIQQNNKKPVPANTSKPVEKKPEKKEAHRVSGIDAGKPRVALTDLGARQCRWPVGDPREESFGFCGDHIHPGLPYCREHAQVAYQAATRNRILQTEDVQQEIKAQVSKEKKAARA